MSIRALLLAAPNEQLDHQLHPLIEKWDEPNPTSLQVLEVLDHCVHSALGSGFVVGALQMVYAQRLHAEGIQHEDNLPKATWR